MNFVIEDNREDATAVPATATTKKAPPLAILRVIGAVQRSLVRASRLLSPPPFALIDLASGKWLPVCLEVVANLGVADHLEHGPKRISDLAEATGTHEDSLYRLMRALARNGVFVEKPLRTFRLNRLSKPLLTNSPDSMRAMLQQFGSEWSRSCWGQIDRSIATGAPIFRDIFGTDLWGYLEKHPQQGAIFNRSMVDFTRHVAPLVASAIDFSQFRTLVDLGGGSGEMIAVILAANPKLEGVNFDLGPALRDAQATMNRYGVSNRCAIEAGSLFESVPSGHDAYLMKSIVHGFSDDRLEVPMTRIRQAMRPDSQLILVETVVPEERGPYFEFLDLLMLMSTEYGRERTEREFRTMLGRYGFRLGRIQATASPMSVIIAHPC